ncbi:MAG: hypothetical protein KIT35_28705 [Piscinibacter sp.]|uniref:DUF6602 domain-containing protein n=1 Tax=Piscinibacter sp. TaxID=1903157 RepID=UPI002582F952|nr:DUF6602 domain-containing protein [Piscinibacter sp.]MCW5667836.1 hypothetical protein [Piscinibacter sp.]
MVKLDLPAQFERKAKAMLLKIEEGRAAHAVKNIKASGAPFEDAFRHLLSESLPPNNRVASGYFYGADSACSGEADVLIYEDREAFRLDPAPQDQHYVPYTSVSVIGQVKNSARELKDAIKQAHGCLTSWLAMHRNLASTGLTLGGPHQDAPLTFVVCGTCTDKELGMIPEILKKQGRPFVDYIVLLERGRIIAGNLDLLQHDPPFIDFLDYRNVNGFHLCKPEGDASNEQGLALLWFYFALVSKLNLDHGNQLRYHGFCRQISNRYPLRPLKRLV